MSALMKRLERGIAAIKQGDRDTAENLLDEVCAEPGSKEPISGLLADAEQRFYELRARLSGESFAADDEFIDIDDDLEATTDSLEEYADAQEEVVAIEDDLGTAEEPLEAEVWSDDALVAMRDDEADKRLSLSMEYLADDAWVEVQRHEESFRELALGSQETHDTVVTVQSYNSSVTLAADAELPDAVAQNLVHEIEPDREWTECHVEEIRVLKTTLVYKDEPQRPALPCSCQG